MRSDDTEGDYFLVTQGKTGQNRTKTQNLDANGGRRKQSREIGSGDNRKKRSPLIQIPADQQIREEDDEGHVALALGQGKGDGPAEHFGSERSICLRQKLEDFSFVIPAQGSLGNRRYRRREPTARAQQTGDHQTALQEDRCDRQALQIGKVSERLPKTAFSCANPRNAKAPHQRGFRVNLGGKPGIRTLGTLLTFAGFQDRCIQPLCQFPFCITGL